jgi:hypothetical protein
VVEQWQTISARNCIAYSGSNACATSRHLSVSRFRFAASNNARARKSKAGAIRKPTLTNHHPALSAALFASRPPCREAEGSLITAFLIDTLAIRITPKSFHCIAASRSNRHSSDPRKLHKNCAADSVVTARSTSESEQTRAKSKTVGKLPFSHTFSTLFHYAEPQCYPLESAPWSGFL